MPTLTLVVAGNYAEYKDFISHKVGRWKYVDGPNDLQGITPGNASVLYVGSWAFRSDLNSIDTLVLSHNLPHRMWTIDDELSPKEKKDRGIKRIAQILGLPEDHPEVEEYRRVLEDVDIRPKLKKWSPDISDSEWQKYVTEFVDTAAMKQVRQSMIMGEFPEELKFTNGSKIEFRSKK